MPNSPFHPSNMKKLLTLLVAASLFMNGCKKDDDNNDTVSVPKLLVKLQVDSTQARLGNIGTPVSVPAGHAAQSPRFHKIAAHYLELAPNAYTLLGAGAILYHAPETTAGGSTAIDFSRSKVVAPGGVFLEIPLKDIPAGSYNWVRLS
ncbi:MAG: hypothetical protein RL021_493, partial [Bacteroidota bacterium]